MTQSKNLLKKNNSITGMIGDKYNLNYRKIPFWSRKERFNIRAGFFPTPGPGHYSINQKYNNNINCNWGLNKLEVTNLCINQFITSALIKSK